MKKIRKNRQPLSKNSKIFNITGSSHNKSKNKQKNTYLGFTVRNTSKTD